MTLVPNRPSDEGRAVGKELARLADAAEAETLKRFPNAKVRCKSCAFRAGTFPNGCLATVGDALKCVLEQRPFYCHEKPANENPTELCAGYAAAMLTRVDTKPIKAPWPFDNEIQHACDIPEDTRP